MTTIPTQAGRTQTGSAPASFSVAAVRRRREKLSWSVIALLAILATMLAPALIYLFQTSLFTTRPDGSPGDFTFGHWNTIFSNPIFIRDALNTAIYSIGSAVFAIACGVVQAWIVARTDTPLRQYVFLFSIVSLGIPGVLHSVVWILLLGRTGPANEILVALTGATTPVLNVYSMWGMIVLEGLNWTPMAFLLIFSVFNSADASYEEAAVMSGAGIGRTFRDITLQLALPGVLALALLITIRAFESFEVPGLVGLPGRIYVLTTEIYTLVNYAVPPNYGVAATFSVLLLVMVMTMLHFYGRLTRRAERYQTITGKGYRPRLINLGRARYLTAALLVFFFFVIVLLPLIALFWVSLMPTVQQFSQVRLDQLTFGNYVKVFQSSLLMGSIGNSLILGVSVATLTSLFTLICAWYAARRRRGAWLIDQLAMTPLIFPAIVLGVALMQVYLQVPFPLYGTVASIVIACVIRYLPYGMRYAYAGVIQIHTELEQASSISGAGEWMTLRRIVLPLAAPALITSWLFIFLLSVGAVALPILLTGPDSQLVATALFELWGNARTPEVAAFGLAWAGFMTLLSSLFYALARRYGMSFR